MYLYAIFGFFTNVFLNVKCGLYAKGKLNTMHQLTLYKSLVSEKNTSSHLSAPSFLASSIHAFIQALCSTAVFNPKIQFFCSLLSSLSPWDIPRVDSEEKYSLYSVDKCDFSCVLIYFFICSGSNFCWSFRVLRGTLKNSWQRYIQLAFMRVCRYLSQRVRRTGQ